MHHQPLFYNDEHALRLLKEAPRFFNIFIHEHEYLDVDKVSHVSSSAFSRRDLADQTMKTRFNGKAKYRIVVRLKTAKEKEAAYWRERNKQFMGGVGDEVWD